MIDFIHFARGFYCDFIIFERLQNLGTFTSDEFQKRAIHLSEHPLHEEFRNIIADPIFGEKYVWNDFEWTGSARINEEQAKDRLVSKLTDIPVQIG